MPDNTCLPRETLKQYLAGWTDPDRSHEIESHLNQCAVCEETIVALEQEPDTLLGLISAAAKVAPDGPNQCNSALDQANKLSEVVSSADLLPHVAQSIGPYHLLRPLGSGGMGTVYVARHTQLGKQVAIKVLPLRVWHREHFAARFQREIRAAGGLDHPAIVTATDAGEHDGVHYLAMELIEGLDLSQLARATGPLSIADACELIRQSALGLSHAHAAGIVHRDIKPSNLMLSRRGQVKILDFGLARLGPWDEASAELTTVGQLMGTLDYMAPEQAERPESVDYRADLYSLGATLFRLLCGRAPLVAAPDQSPLAKLRLLATARPPKLRTLRPDAPDELEQLVAQMLSFSPDDRPPSAAHVAEQIAAFCVGHNLTLLVEHGLQAREAQQLDSHDPLQPPSISPAPALAIDGDPGEESPHNLTTPHSRKPRWPWMVTTCVALAGSIFSGITLWIDSQQGWLHIESDTAVTVQVQGDGQTVKQWRIQPGENSTQLYAGKYQIELAAGSDGVQIDHDRLQIIKGGVVIAHIAKTPPFADAGLNSSTELKAIPPASTALLRPGDALRMLSRSDESINHEFAVQADNTVKVPFVGTVPVAGLSLDALEKKLNELYTPYLRKPMIEVYRSSISNSIASIASGTSDQSIMANNGQGANTTDEPMYNGRPLSEWMHLLLRERSSEGIMSSLEAIQGSITQQTAPQIADLLRRNLPEFNWGNLSGLGGNSRDIYVRAFHTLQEADPLGYQTWIIQQLDDAKSEDWRLAILRWALPYRGATSSFEELAPLRDWLKQQAFSQPGPESAAAAEYYLKRAQNPNDPQIEAWLAELIDQKHTPSQQWLTDIMLFAKDIRNELLWSEIIRRAAEVLSDPQTSNEDIVYACGAILQLPSYSTAFDEFRPQLTAAWQFRANQLADSEAFRTATVKINQHSDLASPFRVSLDDDSIRWSNITMNVGGGGFSPSHTQVYVLLALTQALGVLGETPDALVDALVPGTAECLRSAMPDFNCTSLQFRQSKASHDRVKLTIGGISSGSNLRIQWPIDHPHSLYLLAFDNLYSSAWKGLPEMVENTFDIPILGKLFLAIEQLQSADLVKEFDTNADGTLDYAEYERLLTHFSQEIEIHHADIRAVDTNDDQQITVDEIVVAKRKLLEMSSFSKKQK